MGAQEYGNRKLVSIQVSLKQGCEEHHTSNHGCVADAVSWNQADSTGDVFQDQVAPNPT
jgi:hypothetical protein